jgi:hypothetical protein
MPSHQHESQLLLFRNRSVMTAELLSEALEAKLPLYTQARTDSANLTEVQPAEYRADLVVHLVHEDAPVMGVVVEVQLAADERKRFVWPVYVVNLRARLKCPVCLLVVTLNEAVARWAAQPIEIGGESRFVPLVLGPSEIPEIRDESQARANPELAVLSVMAHGRRADLSKAVAIGKAALAACVGLDEDRCRLYVDLVYASLSVAAREELQMDSVKYEYQSDFAKRYVAQGRMEGKAEGQAEGRADLVLRLLTVRFGVLSTEDQTHVKQATIDELDAIGVRLLTAETLQQALGPR